LVPGLLLQRFLDTMDAAATEFSHVDYDTAERHLRNAAAVMTSMEGRVSDVERSRTGRVLCVGDEEYPGGIDTSWGAGGAGAFDPDLPGGSHSLGDDASADAGGGGRLLNSLSPTALLIATVLGGAFGVLSVRARNSQR
jgi:hypothetical protein